MKKLLPLISSAFLISAPIGSLIQNLNFTNQNNAIWLAPTSMLNLVKGINNAMAHDWNVENSWWNEIPENRSEENYRKFIEGKSGFIEEKTRTILKENLIQNFDHKYENSTPNKQTFQTQSYQKKVTNTSTIAINFQEQIKNSLKISVVFGDNTLEVSFTSQQTWTNTVSVEETLTAPSQSFIVDPYSIGMATYTIKESLDDVKGIIRFFVPLDGKLDSSKWRNPNNHTINQGYLPFRDLVRELNAAGYGELLKMNATNFSIISADNPSNPTQISINIPIEWQDKTNHLNVKFSQMPLEI